MRALDAALAFARYALYWYTSTNTDWYKSTNTAMRALDAAHAFARYALYLLYWYKSTNTDTEVAGGARCGERGRVAECVSAGRMLEVIARCALLAYADAC
jgi:hypothetical protein